MRGGNLVSHRRPELRQPYMVTGFAGWPNAAEVSTQAILYLIESLQAERFASIEGEGFNNLVSLRPRVRLEAGVVRRLHFPSNEFFFWQEEGQLHDLILFLGVEPHYRWRRYIELITSVATELKVEKCVTLGGTYDQVPHTQPSRISALSNKPELRQELEAFSVGFTNYEGPGSIQTSLLTALGRRGVAGISLWAHAPFYIRLPNIKVCYEVLLFLSHLLNLPLELDDLARQARYMDFQLSQVMEGNPKLAEHVKQLEASSEAVDELPEVGWLISEIEDFLRQAKEED